MNLFKWNESKEQAGSFWNSSTGEIEKYHREIRSDRSIINNPGGFENRVAVEALCRIVSELVKLEEDRNT